MHERKIPRWLRVLGVAGPLLLVGGIVLLININKWNMSLQYDIVYVICDNQTSRAVAGVTCGEYIEYRYRIADGALVVRSDTEVARRLWPSTSERVNEERDPAPWAQWTTRLYIHDVVDDQSREVTPDQLVQLRLTGGPVAPNGTQLNYEYQSYSSPFFIFGRSSGRAVHTIQQGGGVREVDLVAEGGRWSSHSSFRHLGWAKRSAY